MTETLEGLGAEVEIRMRYVDKIRMRYVDKLGHGFGVHWICS